MSLKSCFDDVIVPNERGKLYGDRIRDFAKWWFDLLKNILVVATLWVLGRKTENPYLVSLALLSYLVLLVHCVSYAHSWRLNAVWGIRNPRGRELVRSLLASAIFFVLLMVVQVGLSTAVDEIVSGQVR